jgi:hypothetical protein
VKECTIRTLGMRLVKLTPVHGFATETAASAVRLVTLPAAAEVGAVGALADEGIWG